MAYEVKNYDGLLGLKGFSDILLKNHFTLYSGYVANTNKLVDKMNAMIKEGKTGEPEYAELKRRFGWEFNGMRLHELYFSNLTKDPISVEHAKKVHKKMIDDFGSVENFEKDFKSSGAMRGIGWVITYYDISAKKIFNIWVNEHDVGHLSGCVPILVLDVFEHAYMVEYGLKKADYITSFFSAIDWKEVEKRIEWVKD